MYPAWTPFHCGDKCIEKTLHANPPTRFNPNPPTSCPLPTTLPLTITSTLPSSPSHSSSNPQCARTSVAEPTRAGRNRPRRHAASAPTATGTPCA